MVVGGGLLASKALEGMSDRHYQKKIFGEMFQAVPELRQEDRRQVEHAYSVLTQIAPKLARNPVSSGQIVKQLVNQGNVADVPTLKSLAETEQVHQNALRGRSAVQTLAPEIKQLAPLVADAMAPS